MSGEGVCNPLDETEILADIADVQEAVDAIQVDVDLLELDVDAIREVTDSEAILTEIAGQITTDGNEQTVYTEENPAGIFEPRILSLDFTNQTVAGTLRVRVYYREARGGGMIKRSDTSFAGVQDPLSKEVTLRPNRYGIRATILGTGETKAFNWEVFYEEAP